MSKTCRGAQVADACPRTAGGKSNFDSPLWSADCAMATEAPVTDQEVLCCARQLEVVPVSSKLCLNDHVIFLGN
eukprot:s2183_g10.t1